MKKIVLLIVLFSVMQSIIAQDPSSARNNTRRFFGRVVDSKTNRGIEAASIQVYTYYKERNVQDSSAVDSSSANVKDSLAGGMLTHQNGDFNVADLPGKDSLRLEITAIGYKDYIVTLRLDGNAERDLGNIKLEPDAQFLSTVTVTGQKGVLQMDIDRKVFNVERSITSTGGTAIDVLKNIPSVSVDVDGNVTLRNNSPQIFVDGLPTILTMDQIPADQIERVELFTNSSAKFDASSRGGIINIILKKNRKAGLNGIITAGAGYPKILTGNLTLNLRQGKFNFFGSANYNQSGGIAQGYAYRTNKAADTVQSYSNQNSEVERLRKFNNIRFGIDFFADNRNTITLSQGFVNGTTNTDEVQKQEFLNNIKDLERTGNRIANSTNDNYRSNTQLSYRHKFAEQGKELSADVNYNYGSSKDHANIVNSFYNPDGIPIDEPARVRNDGSNSNKQLTMQIDFIDPKGENKKLETGVRSYYNIFNSTFNSFALDNGGGETKLPLSNNYRYTEMVNAAYFTYTNKMKSWGYQVGLRFEHSEFDGELIDSARKFGYEFPNSWQNLFDGLFPSVYLTKNLGEGEELQLNYTRKIRRPNFWQLNPYVDISDPFNIQAGNPTLQPEFTNSFELNYSKDYETGNFLGVAYYQNSQGDITRFSDTISQEQLDKLNNAGIDPNAILNTFINAQSENTLGTELTLTQKIGKNFDFIPTVDLQYKKVNVPVHNLSNQGFVWEGEITLNYRIATKQPSLFNKMSFQLIGNYESKEITAQGYNKAVAFADFALRKDFLKGNKASFVFNVNDIFNSRRFINIYDTDNFYQEAFRRRNVRNFRLTFTYRFGKADFNLFKKNRQEGQDQDNGDER